ncbi:hypothetical protein HDV00_003307 [Rhizophlyctis rosea]|nr:hypothetical protein HDV00_003307 [Rhizophlyctis rosea]
MGHSGSKEKAKEAEDLSKQSHFTQGEILKMQKEFERLADDEFTIDKNDFKKACVAVVKSIRLLIRSCEKSSAS